MGLKKAEFLEHWKGLPDTTPGPALTMQSVPYKHEGSTYAEDGIRITGSRKFIDSVLVTLKPLLARNNAVERLQVVYKESSDRETGADLGSWNCYIQVHQRGGEAQYLNLAYGNGRILSGE